MVEIAGADRVETDHKADLRDGRFPLFISEVALVPIAAARTAEMRTCCCGGGREFRLTV